MVDLTRYTNGVPLDTDNVPEPDTFEPLPAGQYEAIVTEEGIKNSDSAGDMVKVVFTVTQEPYNGRKVFHYLCVEHPKQDVADRAWKQLAQLSRAVGIQHLSDTAHLLDKGLVITLNVKDDGKGFGPQNNVTNCRPIGSAPPAQTLSAPVSPGTASTPEPQRATQRPSGPPADGQPVWMQNRG